MEAEHKVGAVQLSARLRGVSPPVTRRLRVAEQTSLAELHAALQVAFGATSITTWKRHVASIGVRLDREAHERVATAPTLNEFGLPKRNPLQAVGDGGYVKASNAPSCQEGWFEVMVGKSLPRAGTGQVFAFVHRLEAQPTERMERFLAEQGVFPAEPTIFLSDGGETVRQAQGEFRQFGEPILDWFHVAMRMTQLSQAIKGLPTEPSDEQDPAKHVEECLRLLRRAKAYLWLGSPHRALETPEDLTWEVGTESESAKAVQDKLEEFMGYVTANLTSIPNYADRHRNGEPIATGFVESAVNQVVSKRLVNKQQMEATSEGWSEGMNVIGNVLKFGLLIQRVRIPSGQSVDPQAGSEPCSGARRPWSEFENSPTRNQRIAKRSSVAV